MHPGSCPRIEPKQTTADINLARVVVSLESAIHDTAEIVLHKCKGTEELRPEYIKKLGSLYFLLYKALRLTEDN